MESNEVLQHLPNSLHPLPFFQKITLSPLIRLWLNVVNLISLVLKQYFIMFILIIPFESHSNFMGQVWLSFKEKKKTPRENLGFCVLNLTRLKKNASFKSPIFLLGTLISGSLKIFSSFVSQAFALYHSSWGEKKKTKTTWLQLTEGQPLIFETLASAFIMKSSER